MPETTITREWVFHVYAQPGEWEDLKPRAYSSSVIRPDTLRVEVVLHPDDSKPAVRGWSISGCRVKKDGTPSAVRMDGSPYLIGEYPVWLTALVEGCLAEVEAELARSSGEGEC